MFMPEVVRPDGYSIVDCPLSSTRMKSLRVLTSSAVKDSLSAFMITMHY